MREERNHFSDNTCEGKEGERRQKTALKDHLKLIRRIVKIGEYLNVQTNQ